MALTLDEMRHILKRVTYRPGWDFTVADDRWEGAVLRIEAVTENAYNTSVTLRLDIVTYLSPNDRATEDTFLTYLAYRLGRIENHEMREFLRLDGEPLHDPHKETS